MPRCRLIVVISLENPGVSLDSQKTSVEGKPHWAVHKRDSSEQRPLQAVVFSSHIREGLCSFSLCSANRRASSVILEALEGFGGEGRTISLFWNTHRFVCKYPSHQQGKGHHSVVPKSKSTNTSIVQGLRLWTKSLDTTREHTLTAL